MKHRRILIQIWLVLLALSTSIAFSQAVTKIAAGVGHSLFLKSDGSLWAMGDNWDGQLGDDTYNNTNQP
jgi:alpha-tubulin suppressor-like RCC1 family protein